MQSYLWRSWPRRPALHGPHFLVSNAALLRPTGGPITHRSVVLRKFYHIASVGLLKTDHRRFPGSIGSPNHRNTCQPLSLPLIAFPCALFPTDHINKRFLHLSSSPRSFHRPDQTIGSIISPRRTSILRSDRVASSVTLFFVNRVVKFVAPPPESSIWEKVKKEAKHFWYGTKLLYVNTVASVPLMRKRLNGEYLTVSHKISPRSSP